MPREVQNRITECGGYLDAIISVVPAIAHPARVFRPSTSACIRRQDTDEPVAGSDGLHLFVVLQNGADAPTFLQNLHDRLWLSGYGWLRIGAAGQALDRTLADRMVGRPERLVFEAPPMLDPNLIQDLKARRAVAVEGDMLDAAVVCPPLSDEEQAALTELQAREVERIGPEGAAARRKFLKRQARRIIDRNPGMDEGKARRAVERQLDGVLLPSIELDFVDETLAGATVADVLADPKRYAGEKLADPIEGRTYDPDCAYVNRRSDGSPWIYSFAHGGCSYSLRYDAEAIQQALEATPDKSRAAELSSSSYCTLIILIPLTSNVC